MNSKNITKFLSNGLVWGIGLTIGIAGVFAYTTGLGGKVATNPLKSADWNNLVSNIDEVNNRTNGISSVGGNIGIGTNSPNRNLQIYSSGVAGLSIGTLGDNLLELSRIDFINNGGNVLGTAGSLGWIVYSRGNNYGGGENNNFGISSFNGTTRNPVITSNLNGNVGIGNLNTSYRLRVNGAAGGTSAYANASDIRFKKNIETITGSLDKINNLRGVYFDWRTDEFKDKNFENGKEVGFIAQEVEKVLPEVVTTDSDGYKAVKYSNMNAVLVEAIKEQQKQIESQNQKIDKLIKNNKEQQKQINILLSK
ncbi:MAG: tail fiber domain-containing protein [Candidatus Gracilibacteria bacterium]|nr:tail fiber domain-containing protein [Candidatus Gracilibacteria bacterium]MDD2908256.1 tail fiber domain-containing protein [Candidatus Gracilibacteria bacterium]